MKTSFLFHQGFENGTQQGKVRGSEARVQCDLRQLLPPLWTSAPLIYPPISVLSAPAVWDHRKEVGSGHRGPVGAKGNFCVSFLEDLVIQPD